MYLMPITSAFTSFSKFLGTKMGIRLILLLVVGLGALYTIHLLAQDWMKIQAGSKFGNVFNEKFKSLKHLSSKELKLFVFKNLSFDNNLKVKK